MSNPARVWPAAVVAAVSLCGAVGARPVPEQAPSSPAPAPVKTLPSMRAAGEPGRTITLEVATRTFVPAPGAKGPTVSLVGVAHIGESALYRQLQGLLDEHDVVLYESVMPPGAGGAGGDTDAQRVASTHAVMNFTAGVLGLYRAREGRYPADMTELASFVGRRDTRLGQWLGAARKDAWGGRIRYAVDDGRLHFALTSEGADRSPGGAGAAADIEVTSETQLDAGFLESDEDNLQAELAKALGLEFQLDGIDYDHPSFRCSDMSMDQLERALEAEGLDMAPLEGSLAASSLPGRITVFLLRVVRTLDIFFDGMIADALKVMLIELFSDEAFLEQSMRQFGEGFARVLIEQRNQVVVDDLKVIIENERDVRSLAIFYGAAHMPDMAARLSEQLGYRLDSEQWFTAFEVDLTETAMSPAQLQNLRVMIRRQLRLMSR